MTKPALHHVHVGERFGSLTVTQIGLRYERSPSQIKRRQVGERAALCACQCGGQRLVRVGELVRGRVTSCGCQAQRSRKVLDTSEILARADGSAAAVHGEAAPTPAQDEPAPVRRRRGGRPAQEIDTTPYTAVIEEASRAYMLDSRYLESMLNSAVQIQRKRNTWTVRTELRDAERQARAACEVSSLTSCVVTEPCSTGSCPFAQGDLAALVGIPSLPRTGSTSRATRPQPRPEHAPGFVYSVEAALQPLIELRSTRGTLDTVGQRQPARNTG